ncbi:unnamed protein product [Boreogadus saida]
MALLSFVVPLRLKLVLMLLAIYNVGSSAAVNCSNASLHELQTDVKNLNKAPPHFHLNITSSEQRDLSDVTDLKCKENPTSDHFMDGLKGLTERLNNLAQVKWRRSRRRRSVWTKKPTDQ